MKTSTAGSRLCIYCGSEKSLGDFSLEHIFPDSLGGTLCSGLFKTDRVCKRCNNLSGLFVDGVFIKSLFRTNAMSSAALSYVDPRVPDSISPLAFLGTSNDLSIPIDQTCDVWLGACGEQLYHIHRRDDPRWDSIVGGNPVARRSDPGRLFILFTTTQQDWLNLCLRSAKNYFPKAARYGVGVQFACDPADQTFLDVMDQDAQRVADEIWALPNEKSLGTVINTAFDERFMCKLALGLGLNMYGDNFLTDDYTRKLREALWQIDLQKRHSIGLYGTPLFSSITDPTAEIIGWKGAYTVRLQGVNEKFALSLHLQDCSVTHTVISINPLLWRQREVSEYWSGMVFLIVPQIKEFIGPLSFAAYMMHKMGIKPLAELDRLEAMRIDASTLPAR